MKNFKNRIIAATPFVALLIFLVFGFYMKDYFPNPWLVGSLAFLLIPINSLIFSTHWKRHLKSIIFFLALLTFLILGIQFNAWHPGWVVFLVIPLYDLLVTKRIDVFKIATIIILTTYILIGILTKEWNKAWIIILLIPIISILLGPHSILDFNPKETRKRFKDFINIDDEEENV